MNDTIAAYAGKPETGYYREIFEIVRTEKESSRKKALEEARLAIKEMERECDYTHIYGDCGCGRENEIISQALQKIQELIDR